MSEAIAPTQVAVLVPYVVESRDAYLDAIGTTRGEALAHFTRHGRHDFSLSDIFHLQFVPSELHYGAGTMLRSDLLPVCVAVRKVDGTVFVQATSFDAEECARTLAIFGHEPEQFEFTAGGIRMSGDVVL